MCKINQLKDYVPRHIRLGVSCFVPEMKSFQDVPVDIPVVDSIGNVVESHKTIKRVPAVDVMAAYNVERFRLSALVKAGVPLDVVNVNRSSTMTIEELNNLCENLDATEKFVSRVMEQRRERESWFTEIKDESNVDLNEIY